MSLVDIKISHGHALLSDHHDGTPLMTVPAKYVTCRMPGEVRATFEADISEHEIDLLERVAPSRGGLTGF